MISNFENGKENGLSELNIYPLLKIMQIVHHLFCLHGDLVSLNHKIEVQIKNKLIMSLVFM
jgi:hypothetical protein